MQNQNRKNRGSSRKNETTSQTKTQASNVTIHKAKKELRPPEPGNSLVKPQSDYLAKKALKAIEASKRSLPEFEQRRVFNKTAIDAWAASVDNPEELGLGVRCPINQNIYPPYASTTIRTAGETVFSVPSGSAFQVLMMPHSSPLFADEVDGDSFHSYVQVVGAGVGTNYFVGPVPGIAQAAPGFVWEFVPGNWGQLQTATNVASCTPVLYSTNVPYSVDATPGGHTKWQLVSAATTIINDTALATRGGQFFSVKLTRPLVGALSYIERLTYEPSWKMHNSDGCRETYLPSNGNMSFWHVLNGNVTGDLVACTGTLFLYNNTTPTTQSLRLAHVENWEIDGYTLRSVTSPLVHDERDLSLGKTALVLASAANSSLVSAMKNLATKGATQALSYMTNTAAKAVAGGSTLIPRLLAAAAI